MKRRSQSGSTLMAVLTVMLTLVVCLAASLEYTSTIARNANRSQQLDAAKTMANGALDMAYAGWREICRETPNVALSTSAFNNLPLPAAANFPNFTGAFPTTRIGVSGSATISNYGVIAVDPQLVSTGSSAPTPAYGQSLTPASGTSFTNDTSFYYLASADVTLPTLGGNVTAKARRVFQKQLRSPWRYAIFYVDPLEIEPGAQMTVTGPVHTNSTLYTPHGSNTTFASEVGYSNNWSIGFMPNDPSHYGETPTSPSFAANLPPSQQAMEQPFGLDSTRIFSTTDPNPNNDSYHELIDIPVTGSPDPLSSSRFYDLADVKILINASNTVTILDASGNTCTSSSTGARLALYQSVNAALTTNGSLQDNREGATVRIATLDVGTLSSTIASKAALAGFKGIIYVADTSATSSARRGIKLTNGGVITQSTGLTIASPNPVYIKGDYNTGTSGGTQPQSNSGTPSQPTATGYTRKPCAIAADAINILSNAWSDSNSTRSISSRIASNTTINAAFMGGIVPTTSASYSGGVENYPRFHEDWSGGKTFTYYGSMVELYQSEQATGLWSNASYNPPVRQWYFDTNFSSNPPPGPNVTNYIKQQWFIQ